MWHMSRGQWLYYIRAQCYVIDIKHVNHKRGQNVQVKSTETGLSTHVLVVDAGGAKGLDLSQPAINAIDIEWYRAGNTPCTYRVAGASECQQ